VRIAIDRARRGKNCGGSFIKSAGFCYNASVKRWFFLFCVVPLLLSILPAPTFAQQAIPDFILQLQQDLSARRLEAYLEAYAPVLRPSQRSEFNRYFDELKMDSVILTWANVISAHRSHPLPSGPLPKLLFRADRDLAAETGRVLRPLAGEGKVGPGKRQPAL
jgi:hypothetical protein